MSKGPLESKVAIVTGGGLGIGRGVARCLASQGAAIVIAEIDSAAGISAKEEFTAMGAKAHFIRTDVGVKADIEYAVAEAASRFGGVDILVNNAVKIATDKLLEDKSDDMLAEQLAIGVWGPWWAMRAVLPWMKKAGSGRIINFTSGDVLTGAWLHSDYNIAKGGVEALTRSAATEWARFNILVNAIAPVAASSAYQKMCEMRPGFHEKATTIHPLGRIGDPDTDIGPAVAFLASEAARYITGTIIPVDGGIHLSRVNSKPAGITGS